MKRYYLLFIIIILLFGICPVSFYAQEALRVNWPDEYQWKIVTNQENEELHILEIIPGKDSIETWTILGQMMSIKNMLNADVEKIAHIMHEEIMHSAAKARMRILEKDLTEKSHPAWILYSIEAPFYTDTHQPESHLWYIRQGNTALFIVFVAVKQKKLSRPFIKKWSKIFLNSQLITL